MAKNPTPDTTSEPERRDFICAGRVKHDGAEFEIGEPVSLDQISHAALYAAGAVADPWE